jgi:hypothetical protein
MMMVITMAMSSSKRIGKNDGSRDVVVDDDDNDGGNRKEK